MCSPVEGLAVVVLVEVRRAGEPRGELFLSTHVALDERPEGVGRGSRGGQEGVKRGSGGELPLSAHVALDERPEARRNT